MIYNYAILLFLFLMSMICADEKISDVLNIFFRFQVFSLFKIVLYKETDKNSNLKQLLIECMYTQFFSISIESYILKKFYKIFVQKNVFFYNKSLISTYYNLLERKLFNKHCQRFFRWFDSKIEYENFFLQRRSFKKKKKKSWTKSISILFNNNFYYNNTINFEKLYEHFYIKKKWAKMKFILLFSFLLRYNLICCNAR